MKLFKHQAEDVQKYMDIGGLAGFVWEVGLGKTIGTLEAFKRLKQYDRYAKLVVIAPLTLLEAAWRIDCDRFYPQFKIFNIHRDLKRKKMQGYIKDADIYVVNYEWLLHNDIKKYKYTTMIALDESSKIKNNQAKTTKKLLKMSKMFDSRLVMSATPAPNCETEYWAQVRFVDETMLPKSFYQFRNIFFYLERENDGSVIHGVTSSSTIADLHRKGFKYQMSNVMREQLMSIIKKRFFYRRAIDCLDLPKVLPDQIRHIKMTDKQAKIYRDMKRDLIVYIKGMCDHGTDFNDEIVITANVVLTKIIKMRQITAGFIMDEDSQPIPIMPVSHNPKTKELMHVLDELGNNQVIIWCNYHYEIQSIEQLLGQKCVTLYGKTKDKDRSIQAFKSGDVKYLIAHPASASYGLTFVNCYIQYFYSLDYSYEKYVQARGRTNRFGQKRSCLYIHSIVPDTIDEIIYDVLTKKGNTNMICKEFLR